MNELKDQAELMILLGKEIIHEKLEDTWESFINEYQKMNLEDAREYLSMCDTIVKYLLKFKNYRKGREIAQEFYANNSHKNNYYKKIVDAIATFAPFPESIHFIQGYYESFIDITREEESALTDKITSIRNISDLMNIGLSYEGASSLNNHPPRNLSLNSEVIPLIHWDNELYAGLNSEGELTIYQSIKNEYDVLYVIKEDTYSRLINRQAIFSNGRMLASKTIVTDELNKIIEASNYDISIGPNFYDLRKKGAYYQKVCDKINALDPLFRQKIKEDAAIVESECPSIFEKLDKENKMLNNQTK